MKMKKTFITILATPIIILILVNIFSTLPKNESNLKELKQEISKKHIEVVDHTQFKILQQDFKTPQEVTLACLTCHNETHKEVLQSSHWQWDREEFIKGRGVTQLGKKNILNNFCIGIGGSEQTCTRCHVGYGWKDNTFDFNKKENIDCLICHDNTEKYIKKPAGAGYPDEKVNLTEVAQKVGTPERSNCGVCHFYGGGGNNVKHGDLEESMFNCKRDVDVHMGINSSNMSCTDCHTTEHHNISGQMYSVSSMNKDRVTCEQCHTQTPHANNTLNEHTKKVACQTCHIPTYAKVNPTKLSWDWSTAGKLKDGKPYHETDADGNHTYLSIKGSFKWGKNLNPEYIWFNGTADHYLVGDIVDTSEVIKMNTLHGNFKDSEAKIIPVKIHRAKQIFDCKNKMIIQPKLFAEKEGEGGYWKDFDWNIASKLGMQSIDEPYSGHFCFVKTEMTWPLNHMVSDKTKSLSCIECHTRDDGRLKGLTDFYMPGRNYNATIDNLGLLLILLSLGGVIIHGFIRIITSKKR